MSDPKSPGDPASLDPKDREARARLDGWPSRAKPEAAEAAAPVAPRPPRGAAVFWSVMAAASLLALVALVRWRQGAGDPRPVQVLTDVQRIQNAVDLYYKRTGVYPGPNLVELRDPGPEAPAGLPAIIPTRVTGQGGFFYDPVGHRVHPNVPGVDASGRPYSSYNELPAWAMRAKEMSESHPKTRNSAGPK